MVRIVSILFLIFLVSCSTEQEQTQAEIFGRDIISSELPEFATAINSDGTEVFFNRTTADRTSMWIMTSRFSNGEWSKPVSLAFSKGLYTDVDPFLTHEGNRLYFSSNRPVADTLTAGEFNTWYVDRNGEDWSSPILANLPLNSDSTEIFISIAKNGNAYFVSERGEGRGIVRSSQVNGNYQPTEDIQLKLNGEAIYASNPCISSDESFLIVAARPNSSTPPDLFISRNENGQWGELKNLGPLVNTPEYAEFAPALSKDDKTLYFTSERPGLVPPSEEGVRPPGDIYQISLEGVLKTLK